MGNYLVRINATEDVVEQWSETVATAANRVELSDHLDIRVRTLTFVDHGQNPVDDENCLPYIEVLSPVGRRLYPSIYGAGRVSTREREEYVADIMDRIKRDMG